MLRGLGMREGQSKTFFLCVPKYIPILLHSVGCIICALAFLPEGLEWPPPPLRTARCLPTTPQPAAKSFDKFLEMGDPVP